MARQIDPLDDVEWIPVEGNAVRASEREARYRRYRRGRPTPIAAILHFLLGKQKTITLWVTPEDASAALDDLDAHAHPKEIDGALISRLLRQAMSKRRAYRLRSSSADGVRISTTAEGARALLDDLTWHSVASRADPRQIRQSVAATFLRLAIEAAQSRRRYVRDCIEYAVRSCGPWIYRFARTVTNPHDVPTKNDLALLRRILAAAERAGYGREPFYSTHPAPRLLGWPLQAFLFELCVGIRKKGDWWTDSGLTSPFDLVQQELSSKRKRGSYAVKLTGFYKLFLGRDWRVVVDQDQPVATNGAPAPIMRALRQLHA